METTNQVQEWWYENNGERKGPVTEQEIIEQINCENIKYDNLIWTKDFSNWEIIQNTEFKQYFSTDTPPPLTGDAVNNTFVWLLAFAPILGQILEGIYLELHPPTYENDFHTYWYATLALNIIFCQLDEKKLVKAGIDTSKMGSAFLIPVYLYKRAEVLKQNSAYFWVWLITFIITIFS